MDFGGDFFFYLWVCAVWYNLNDIGVDIARYHITKNVQKPLNNIGPSTLHMSLWNRCDAVPKAG